VGVLIYGFFRESETSIISRVIICLTIEYYNMLICYLGKDVCGIIFFG